MSYVLVRRLRQTSLFSQLIRVESTMTNLTQEELVFRPPVTHWSKVIRDAEKIVGYPTSFMNLRWLLSDEFANMASYLRKLVGSNHPILQTAKTVLYNEQNNLQPWGLVILLLSNAVTPTTQALQAGNLAENQRILAELTEMIRTGHYVHRGLLNTPVEERGNVTDTAMFGNKIALLIGDYLLVTANGMLARLKNQDLSYLISTALRDMSEGEFFGERDKQNMPLPGAPLTGKGTDEYHITSDSLPLVVKDTLGHPVREWTVRTLFSGGSLFGRGCQGALLLAGQTLEEQEMAYLFGCHLNLAWQAGSELQKLTSNNQFSLVSAPVLFALNKNPDLYHFIVKNKEDVSQVDYERLKCEVLATDAVERTKSLYEENASKAENYIKEFGDNKSIDTVRKLINTF
ncbi:all trans-polyprenyl-diphosphate synthase PDSS2 [Plutella xylostella]|uniref:all trans-polyprenyl-diphosphate synthase PDSS2 n=1 Tax=Plutella xylostella TaxID=51655 RepID=UPI0020321EA9|nr:all trans-polyprenyl-diphosphate synthase PDSS2 [Plutella xylostella]